MKTRVSRLHLTLLLFLVCAATYSSIYFYTPISAAESQDQQDEKQNDKGSPDEAAQFYLGKRLPEGEKEIPVERYLEARERMLRMPRYSAARNEYLNRAEAETGAVWTELGPGNVGGRTRALIIHPANQDTMYAAAASGGVWKTTDGGASWKPLTDVIANIAVNALAMDRNNPDVLYAGTGEGFFNFDAIRGAGIFKSADGGLTWSRLMAAATPDFHYVNDIVVSPTDGRRVYAATRSGVWRSVDGGANWTRTLDPAAMGGCLDLVIRNDQTTDYLFASCGTFTQAKVYRNTDAGGAGAWTEVLNDAGMGRTSLALAPSNQNIIYAASANPATSNQPGLHAIFRSTAGGDPNTWTAQVRKSDATKLNTVLFSWTQDAFFSDCGIGPSRLFNTGWYANAVAVDPVDANRVWVGGVDLFRSDDGGANWGLASYSWIDANAPQYAHRHHHAIIFHRRYDGAGNRTMFAAGDGGIYKTVDALAATATGKTAPCNPANSVVRWTSLNRGYAATQLYHGVPHPDGTRYLAGASSHGFLQGSDGEGVNGWRQMLGGDGGLVAIDPANPSVIYTATSGSLIRKSVDGGQTFAPANHGISDPGFVYIAPLAIDPSDGARLWTGGRALWSSASGAARWNQASPARQQGSFTAIAVAPDDSNIVLAGTNTGSILRNEKALAGDGQWTGVAPRAGYVSWLAFDPADHNLVYATYSTFGGTHVWRSADGGATWTGIDGAGTGALPDVPVHSIVVDPQNRNRLFIGTDVGVFATTDGGETWAVESGAPNVVTEVLALNAGSNTSQLFAFTYGRGAWRTALGAKDCRYSLSPASVNVKAEGGAGSVGVTAPNGCPWAASVNASGEAWINITNSSPGSGSGTVGFTVEPNNGSQARTGTIAIAGRSFTISQAGKSDAQRPQVRIVNSTSGPTSGRKLTTEISTITLGGVASDDTSVTQVSWATDRGSSSLTPFPASGQANGTTTWTTPAITLQPGVNVITITARDAAGNTGSAELTVIFNPAATIVTIAGAGNKSAGHPAYYAGLSVPTGMTVDAAGNLYFCSGDGVLKIDARTSLLTVVAGAGGTAELGDGGPATQARLIQPTKVAFDPAGNLIVVDYGQNRVRRITPDGIINTIVGNGCGIPLCNPGNGDGGPAIEARLGNPVDVEYDRAGNLYITELRGKRVRKVDAQTGIITTFAGDGLGPAGGPGGDGGPATQARFEDPSHLAIDAAGNVYIVDRGAHKIRKVTASTGIISTIAGTGAQFFSGDGGPASAATLHSPNDLYLDGAGNLYIADLGNERVRRIAADTGIITTVAGGGAVPPADGASPFAVKLSPSSVAFDQAGHMLIASHPRIYKILPFRTPDTIPPIVNITAPTNEPEIVVNTPSDLRNLRLSGTATDNVGITHITWRNDRSGSGVANINSDRTWTIFSPSLMVGRNNLTVTAWDAAGNGGSAKLTVVFNTDRVARTLAGNQIAGFGGDGGSGVAARLWAPEGIALDAVGNLYVADTGNHRVRKIARDGRISTVAGNGLLGANGDGGPATDASLNSPCGVAVDAAGNLFVSDTGNHRIRKVTTSGVISTVAGVGTEGFGGDGGLAINARLNSPYGLALDAAGNLYVADMINHRVRKIAAGSGVISSVVGGGYGFGGDGGAATAATLSFPRDVKLDAAGNLYVADTANARIRKVTTAGVISTFAGNGQLSQGGDGMPAINSPLGSPYGLAIDQSGNLFFSDYSNSVIRRIGADGIITTVTGIAPAIAGEEMPVSSLTLAAPTGLAIAPAGDLYVAESGRNRVMIVTGHRNVASVQAASFTGPALASEAIVAAFGTNLAAATQVATELPLPTALAGTTVRVRDSLSQEMFAPLFFVSPDQINYQMPPGIANGPATVLVTNQQGATSSGDVMIETTAPGLFSANADGQGVAAATVLRLRADGAQIYEPVSVFDQTLKRFVARPLDFGPPGDQLFLILFGTGLRRAAPGAVNARIGGEPVDVLYVGAQGGFAGLDQINLSLPRTLAGRGEVEVALSIDGKATNTLRIALAGAPCSFQVTAPGQIVPAAGGGVTVSVASASTCFWAARSNASWIATDFNGAASGAGAVTFSVSPNAGPLSRSGEVRVAGQSVSIIQAGAESSPPPAVAVTNPSDTGSFTATVPVMSFGGTASAGVAFLTWSNDRGGNGYAGGTINWTVADVRLQLGVNNLTVTAYDGLGRTGSARFAVNFKPEWEINTVAGGGQNDPAQGGQATSAKLEHVTDLVVDASGNIYLSSGSRVFKVTPAGVLSVFAGNGQSGLGAENVPATTVSIGSAGGLAFDRQGNLYIADISYNIIRKVDIRTNLITTVAGRNAPNNFGFSGDGGPATQARLNYPRDVALDSTGNLFIADASNNRIRRVDAATGIITTVAGNGYNGGPFSEGSDALTTAIGGPNAVAIGPDNNLYVVTNSQIRKINLVTGKITTFVQNGTPIGNGGAVINQSYYPQGLAFDAQGNLLFTDGIRFNNAHAPKVWRVAAGTGQVALLAGDRATGPPGDGGPSVLARLEAAIDVAVDGAGNIYIADETRVRKLTPLLAPGAAASKFTR